MGLKEITYTEEEARQMREIIREMHKFYPAGLGINSFLNNRMAPFRTECPCQVCREWREEQKLKVN